MITRQAAPPVRPHRLPAPPPADVPQGHLPPPGENPGEVFLKSSSACARKLAQIGGFSNGASLGYLAGALAGSAAGAAGPACWAAAVAGAAGGGLVGWKVMGKASDLAAGAALRLAPQHPTGADTAGPVALNLAMDLLSGSSITAAVDLSVTAGWGLYHSKKAHKALPP